MLRHAWELRGRYKDSAGWLAFPTHDSTAPTRGQDTTATEQDGQPRGGPVPVASGYVATSWRGSHPPHVHVTLLFLGEKRGRYLRATKWAEVPWTGRGQHQALTENARPQAFLQRGAPARGNTRPGAPEPRQVLATHALDSVQACQVTTTSPQQKGANQREPSAGVDAPRSREWVVGTRGRAPRAR